MDDALDDALESPTDRHSLIERLVDDGIEWARHARGRSVTIVAIEFNNLETLRADFGEEAVAEVVATVADRLGDLQAIESVQIGNEFVLVSRAPRSTFDAFSLADRVARTLARPTFAGELEITLTASIGVCQSWNGIGGSPTLVRDAQFALDEAKRSGLGKAVVLTPEHQRRRTTNWPEVRMQYAPIVALGDGSASTYEVSVIDGRVTSFADADPSTFELLFEELARTMATWSAGVGVSIKVSREQLGDPDFRRRVAGTARRYALDHDRFAFEIDEREAAEDLLRMQLVVTRLRSDGWTVGLSGLGTRSALDTLALLPVHYAKIDLAPLEGPESESSDVTSLASAARALKIRTVATGIETLSELALALAHEFDFAQGSLFGVQLSAPPAF